MPYIEPHRRLLYKPVLEAFDRIASDGISPGDMNYLITKLLLAWLGTTYSYHSYMACIGTLEMVKHELLRRAVAPYETYKLGQNGDVGFEKLERGT